MEAFHQSFQLIAITNQFHFFCRWTVQVYVLCEALYQKLTGTPLKEAERGRIARKDIRKLSRAREKNEQTRDN